MRTLGFTPLLLPALQSPIITAFESPTAPAYDFNRFYTALIPPASSSTPAR